MEISMMTVARPALCMAGQSRARPWLEVVVLGRKSWKATKTLSHIAVKVCVLPRYIHSGLYFSADAIMPDKSHLRCISQCTDACHMTGNSTCFLQPDCDENDHRTNNLLPHCFHSHSRNCFLINAVEKSCGMIPLFELGTCCQACQSIWNPGYG